MEEQGFYSKKPYTYTNSEHIDLTLKLSPCGQNAEEEEEEEEEKMVEKGLVRFGDLQTMRRVKTWKRLLMKKMRMAAAKEAEKSLPVSPGGGAQTLPHSIYNSLKTFANPCGDAWHEGAMQEMTLWPSETMIENERPAKKLKHVNSYQESDGMPSVITTGDGTITGKRTVCIVCVCHGSFPSPTEFVMHAGGKEVADPMKHITVCSDSFGINGDGAAFITHPF
ncbi:Ninja-family protein AFP3 [Glycine soja]